MSLRICILETDVLRPELIDQYQGYGRMFERLFAQQPLAARFEVFNVVKGDYPADSERYDAYLVTGSKADSFGSDPWIQTLKDYLLQRYENGDKLLGICFGHQLMAQALGGEVAKSDRGWGIGGQTYRDHETGRNIRILGSHQDQVTRAPEGTRLIASSEFCPVAGLVWEDAPAISWQAHPEFQLAFSRALIEDRIGTVYEETLARTALDGLDQPLDSPEIATRIARFFKDQAARKAA